MNIKTIIKKILSLEKGEGQLVLLPFLYSFFAGAALSFFVTSATSLFLSGFKRDMLPVVFIASGVIVWLIGQGFSKFQQKNSFSKSIKAGLAFLLISIIFFLALYVGTKWAAGIFLLYAWIRVFAYLHAVSFWGMLGRLFELRQAKRLFGLITGGEVLASIISFFSIPFLLKFINTESLLFISGVFLLLAYFLILAVVRKNKEKLQFVKKKKTLSGETEKKVSFLDNKYYKLFFLIAFIPIFAQFFVDFIFQAQAKVEFPEKEALTAFVGVFFGVSAIIEFVLKTLISGRMMSKYGIKIGLLAFPVVLLFSFVLVSLVGVFYGTITLFFSFVALGRLFTRAIRTSFNDPATQILYQPLPSDERIAFQNKVESGPKAYASIFAGVLLFIFVKIPGMNLVFFSLFLLVVIIVWIFAAKRIITEYKKMLEKVLENKQISLLKSKHEHIFENLKNFVLNAKTKTQLSVLKLSRIIFPYRTYELIEEQNIDLFKEAEVKKSFKKLVEYSKSEDPVLRRQAASGLPNYPVYRIERLLKSLLGDENFRVRTEAVISAGKTKDPDFFRYLLNNFNTPEYRDTAASAMIQAGDRIIPDLGIIFRRLGNNSDLQFKIIEILEEIGSDEAIKFLKKNLNYPNQIIRKRVVKALGKLDYKASILETSMFASLMEEQIDNYVYFINCLIDLSKVSDYEIIKKALYIEKKEKLSDIFGVLAVLYDTSAINLIKQNVESESAEARGFALEIADMIFSELHKDLLLPILNGLGYIELVWAYRFSFSYPPLSVKERLIDIINSPGGKTTEFTKAAALDYLSRADSQNTDSILKANFVHPIRIIREVAGLHLFNKDRDLFDEFVFVNRQKFNDLLDLQNILTDESIENKLILQKTNTLRQFEIFRCIDIKGLLKLSEDIEEISLKKGESVEINPENASIIYIHISGILQQLETESLINQGEIICIYDTKDNLRKMNYKANSDCILFKTKIYLLNNVLVENEEFAEKYIESVWWR